MEQICTYINTYIHTYIHACMHARMHACIHTYMRRCRSIPRNLWFELLGDMWHRNLEPSGLISIDDGWPRALNYQPLVLDLGADDDDDPSRFPQKFKEIRLLRVRQFIKKFLKDADLEYLWSRGYRNLLRCSPHFLWDCVYYVRSLRHIERGNPRPMLSQKALCLDFLL